MERPAKNDANSSAKSGNNSGDTYLHVAIRHRALLQRNVIEIAKEYLERDLDLNVKNNHEETPLHLAIAGKLKDVADFLLERNADINVTDRYGNSITHYFIEDEFEKIMKLKDSLKNRIDFFIENGMGMTTSGDIRAGSEEFSAQFVEWMLKKGFDFDCKNKKGVSALHLAIKYNLQHMLPALLMHTRDINFVSEHDKQTLLHLFIKASNMFKFSKRQSWCTKFCNRYSLKIVKILLERGVSVDHVDAYGLTAIHMAANAAEELDIVMLLIDHLTKLKDSNCGGSLLHSIIRHSSTESSKADYYLKILQALIAKGVDIGSKDKHQLTPLFYAVKEHNFSATQMLKVAGADFSLLTSDGQNLLHVFAANKTCHNEALLELLIGEGVDKNAKDENGKSPLHLAVENGKVAMIEKLLAHKVDVDCQENVKGWTPLHSAAADRRQSVKIAELLVNAGARVNRKNRWDGRPLHLAAEAKHGKDMMKLLLSHGAHVDARDNFGNSALARAFHSDCADNVQELLANGADINNHCILRILYWGYIHHYVVATFLYRHSIKLRAANLPCSDDYLMFLKRDYSQDFDATCRREVQILRDTYISAKKSLYQWLHMDLIRGYDYVSNDQFVSVVCSSTVQKKFPQFSTVILGHYRRILARQLLLGYVKKIWLMVTYIVLPSDCLECIFSNFSNADLVDFVEMVRPDWLE